MDSELSIPGFTVFRNDRSSSRGGGVLLIVRNTISARRITVPTQHNCELLLVELLTPSPVTVCLIYVSPDPSIELVSSMINLIDPFVRTIILGDFNLPEIHWATLSGSSPSSNLFCDFVFQHNMQQLVLEPTHSKGNTLDL